MLWDHVTWKVGIDLSSHYLDLMRQCRAGGKGGNIGKRGESVTFGDYIMWYFPSMKRKER